MLRTIQRIELVNKLRVPASGRYLIEVTTDDSFDRAHLPGAIPLSLGQVDDWIERDQPERDSEIILYSDDRWDPRASRLGHLLAALGFRNIAIYEAGKDDWLEAGLPIESYIKQEALREAQRSSFMPPISPL